MNAFIITMIILQFLGAAVSILGATKGRVVTQNVTAAIIQLGLATWGLAVIGGIV